MNVDEQAQIQLLALSLKELIQSSAMTALDQLCVFLAVIMRSLGEIRCRGKSGVLQPIMPLDLPVKVRPWELTVYPRSHIRR